MKIKDISQYLFESFKDAQTKFAQEAPEDEVQQYLDTFKKLAKKGTVSGQEKDIGHWIKQGWAEFKGFVDSKSQEKSKSQVKKSKKKDSIIAFQDDDRTVVIPLTKDASCYYGKGTQWCTAATESENHFNDYFYNRNYVLFYVYVIPTGAKFAYATHIYSDDKVQAFDERDVRITIEDFENVTEISSEDIESWVEEYRSTIEKAMNLNNLSEENVIEIVKDNPYVIEKINDPSEKLQLVAVKNDPVTIKAIKNPSDEVQEEAVSMRPNIITHINDPSEKAQLIAINKEPTTIAMIDDPTPKVQEALAKREPFLIRFINKSYIEPEIIEIAIQRAKETNLNNPSPLSDAINRLVDQEYKDRLQIEFVKAFPDQLFGLKNPTDKAQLIAVTKYPAVIAKIKDPADKIIKRYESVTGKEYSPEQIQQDEMDELEKILYPDK